MSSRLLPFVRALVLVAACAAVAALMAPAVARAETPEEQAQRHSERGTVHYNLGQFEEAIAEYRKGYEVLALPEFLFNIGQAYQQLGYFDRALFFYRRYLSTLPDAPNKAEVEARIATLEPMVPAEARLRSARTDEPLPAGSLSKTGNGAGNGTVDLRTPAPAPAPTPVWRRWWVWGLAGLVVATGATAWLVSRGSDRDGVPGSDLGNARFSF